MVGKDTSHDIFINISTDDSNKIGCPKPCARSQRNSAMTGKSRKPLKIRSLPPDDPIYSRGFVIVGIGRNRLPETTPTDPSAKKAFFRSLAEGVGEGRSRQSRGSSE